MWVVVLREDLSIEPEVFGPFKDRASAVEFEQFATELYPGYNPTAVAVEDPKTFDDYESG